MRKEQRPTPKNSTSKPELPLNDPNYHYRIVSKEDETADRVAYHRNLGYGVAHEDARSLTMAVRKEDHEQRQREAAERARRVRDEKLAPRGDVVQDETTIERTRAIVAEGQD
jgi:hypothetical protein